MTIISNMHITLRAGVKEEAIKAFKARRVFEECAQAIPGFLGARLLEVQGSDTAIAVIAEWLDAASFHAWVAHPVRDAQESDLAHFLASAPQTQLYSSKIEFERSI